MILTKYMTRGKNLLKSSKCSCGRVCATDNPYGHMSGKGKLYLKGNCGCKRTKSLPYTHQHLEMEGEGMKKIFKGVYNKVLKPVGKEIIANPGRALQVTTQLGAKLASKNPKAIASAGMQAGKFGVTGNGVKIGDLATGGAICLYR